MSIIISLLLSNVNDSLSGYNILGFQYISLKSLEFLSLTYFSNCRESDVNLSFCFYKQTFSPVILLLIFFSIQDLYRHIFR